MRERIVVLRVCLMLVCIMACQGVMAQSARPKVALALGGGAARGFAHIGVLKWLEEHRIPVDYVAGTSMGGLMGGCYAMGMTPEEIEKMVLDLDWEATFEGSAPYAYQDWRRKQDNTDMMIPLQVGWKKGFKTPSGFDPVHPVGLLLSRITINYFDMKSFDELPIPFRCVATNMDNADQAVLASGSLPQALRATMAIPGVFTPIEIDGKLLVDGGVLNMVPADVARKMGGDIVIAVDVGAKLNERNYANNLLGMIGETVKVVMIDNTRRTLAQADVVVSPDLAANTSWDTELQSEKAGYDAIAKREPLLKSLSLSEEDWQKHIADRKARIRKQMPDISFITVEGADENNQRMIKEQMNWALHKSIDVPWMEKNLTKITGVGRFESLAYQLVHRGGETGLLIKAVEKNYGPPFMNFNMDVNNSRGQALDFSLGVRLTSFGLTKPDDEVRVDAAVGTTRFVSAELYRPFGANGWFMMPSIGIYENTRDLFRNHSRLTDVICSTSYVGFDVGKVFDDKAEMRFGGQFASDSTIARSGSIKPSELENGHVKMLHMKFSYDGWNNALVATDGTRATLEYRYYQRMAGSLRHVSQMSWNSTTMWPVAKDTSNFMMLAAQSSFDQSVSFINRAELGGLFRLGAYTRGTFSGSNMAYGAFGRVVKLGHSIGPGAIQSYGAVWLESGSAFETLRDAQFNTCLSAGLMSEMPFGPIYLGVSYANWDDNSLVLGIGNIIP